VPGRRAGCPSTQRPLSTCALSSRSSLLPIEPVAAEAPATGQCSALHMCFSGHSAFTPHTAFDLRSASPHLECCLCCYSSSRFSHFQSKKPPLLSSDLLRCTWSAAYAATPCPPLLPFCRHLVICSYRISPLFSIFFHPPICLFALGVLPPLYHPSPCPALYLVRPVGPLGPADGSPSLLLPSLRPPYARKILLYSPAPRPVCVAIPSGSHCDASSAPRPVLIPRARAEMLGPLCTRNISDGPVLSAGPPCGWLRRRLTLECPLAVPAMGLISSAPVCVSPGSVPYRKVPAKSGACEICATEFRAPTTRSIMFHALRSPRTVNAPDEAKGSTPPLERV
jgi:hypothetical protein